METYMQVNSVPLRGNIIDNGWIEHLTNENGSTNMRAVLVLSEIVYWYRPVEIRDERSGRVIGYKKKYRFDKLQMSYDSLGQKFNMTKAQAKSACDFLKNKGIITTEFRNIQTDIGKVLNVMFVDLVFENYKKITGIDRVVSAAADSEDCPVEVVQEGPEWSLLESNDVVCKNDPCPDLQVTTFAEKETLLESKDIPLNLGPYPPKNQRDNSPKTQGDTKSTTKSTEEDLAPCQATLILFCSLIISL